MNESVARHEETNKVLFVILGLGMGGAEQQLLKILPHMKDQVVLVSLTNDDAIGRLIEAEGVRVHYLGLRRDLLNLPAVVARFGRVVREFGPDVAYGYLIHSNLFIRFFARMFGVRTVLCSVRNRRIDKPFLSLVDRLTQNLVDLYVPNSPALVEYLVEFQQVPREKIVVLENAIDVTQYDVEVDVARLREELGIDANAYVAVCIAKLRRQKDHATLLRAVSMVDEDLVLVLAGDGPLRHALEAQAAELGIADRIRFLGWRSDSLSIMKASDVFVLSSRFEGMSNALMEAMAARIPAVVSRIPENTALIQDGETGLTFDVGDAEGLARALERIRNDGELRRRLTSKAFDRIVKNDVAKLVAQVREVASTAVRKG